MSTFTIKWGHTRHTYPCDPSTAKHLRNMYRFERHMHRRFPSVAPLGVGAQRRVARDQVAHFLLTSLAVSSSNKHLESLTNGAPT